MTKIWLSTSFHPAFRVGGWAYVRSGGEISGKAGGDRATTARATLLAGAAEAVRAVAGPIELICVRAERDALAAIIGGDFEEATALELASAAQLAKVGGLKLTAATGGPLPFAAGWAELGREKAKATGKFAASIPKTNLAKAPGLSA